MVSADYIQQGLVQRGLPEHIAQGFVMNMQDESGLNPGINERTPLVPGSRGGYGLYQLTGPRRRAYESYASNRGVSFENADAQLDFLMTELQGPERRAAQSIFSTNNPKDAAVAIARDFLRPAASNLQKRVASYTGGSSPQATTNTQGAAPMMQQEEKPRGLLDSVGIQKMEEGAEGETGQRFFQRDSFKDTAALLAQGFGRMGIMGMEEIADDIAKQRTENKARNKTLEYLAQMPNGEELVKLAEIAGPAAVAKQVLAQRFAKPKDVEYETKILKLADGSDVMVERLKGTNDPWQPSQIPAGGTTGSGAPVKKLTEGQSKLTLFQTLQTETQPVLLALENQFDPANLKDPTMSRLPIAGNYFKSPEYQMYETAAAAWAEGALRIATGAAAQQSEIERNIKTYFAQAGDTPQTVAFKARMRDMYSRAVNNSLGQAPTGESLPIPTPADFAEQLKVGSLTQGSTAVGEINSILGAE